MKKKIITFLVICSALLLLCAIIRITGGERKTEFAIDAVFVSAQNKEITVQAPQLIALTDTLYYNMYKSVIEGGEINEKQNNGT